MGALEGIFTNSCAVVYGSFLTPQNEKNVIVTEFRFFFPRFFENSEKTTTATSKKQLRDVNSLLRDYNLHLQDYNLPF